MFANQTVFVKMVDDFGNQLLSGMQTYFFNSSLVQYFIGISATVYLIKLAFSIMDGKPNFGIVCYILAWFACLPFNGKPLGFSFVNAIGISVSYALEKSVDFAMHNATSVGGSGMPPYYAANAFIRAASAKITDPNVKTEINAIMQNCVPDPGAGIANHEGSPLNGLDLLIPTKTPFNSSVGGYEYNFGTQAKDLLVNTPSHVRDLNTGTDLNCFELMNKTQSDIRSNMLNQNITDMPQMIAVGSAPGSNNSTEFVKPNSVIANNVNNIALNMAAATAATYEGLEIFGMKASDTALNSRIFETSGAVGGMASSSLILHNYADIASKKMGIMNTWAIGAKLAELNEKLYVLPSLVATAQVWLKVLAPLAFISMMLGTMRIALTWCGMWFATLIFPVIANIFGSYLSALITARYQFDAAAGSDPNKANFLMTGESLGAIGDVMRDFASHVDTTLNYQLASFGLISTLIIGGAWFSHKLANTAAVSTLANLGKMAATHGFYAGARTLLGGAKAVGAATGAGSKLETATTASSASSNVTSASKRASFFSSGKGSFFGGKSQNNNSQQSSPPKNSLASFEGKNNKYSKKKE